MTGTNNRQGDKRVDIPQGSEEVAHRPPNGRRANQKQELRDTDQERETDRESRADEARNIDDGLMTR